MSAEPQRDIEHDLRAYKQRRDSQLGAPLELHPATRKMLQAEAARTAGRPLLTSEEAAKNFVRSFVLSHQQPGIFARYRARILWGGGMFVCLAVVLLVLRNDPQRTAQQKTFTDTLPTPPPVAEDSVRVPEVRRVAQAPRTAPPTEAAQRARPMNSSAASAPAPVAVAPRGSTVAAPPPAGPEMKLLRDTSPKPAEQASATSLSKDLQATPRAKAQPALAEQEKLVAGAKFKADENLRRERVDMDGAGGSPALGTVAPAAAPASTAAQSAFSYGSQLAKESGSAQQRFRQQDAASYRRNFNSPPPPQVMQDFAFERSGDRVRIVDADGSIYEGTVLADERKLTDVSATARAAAPERKAGREVAAQAQLADAAEGYRFRVTGVNRRLNQSVEFRGEWQPSAPAAGQAAKDNATEFQTATLGGRTETLALEKQAAGTSNSLGISPVTARFGLPAESQPKLPAGRIQGRAILGGRNEFEVNATPK